MKKALLQSGIVGLAILGLTATGCDKKASVDLSKIEASLAKIEEQEGKILEQIKALDDKVGKINARPAAPTAPGAPDPAAVYKVDIANTQIKGNNDALVTIVEWSDFQCPFCKKAEDTMVQLEKDYGDKVRFAFKHNPLSFHKNAMGAALAAEAAGRQGKFWNMHEKLFANAKDLSDENYKKWAQELGLDMKKFEADMADPALKTLVEAQQKQGVNLGARGTPAFFINGRFLSGAQPPENFKKVIDEEFKKAEELVKTGVAKDQVYAKVMEKAKDKP